MDVRGMLEEYSREQKELKQQEEKLKELETIILSPAAAPTRRNGGRGSPSDHTRRIDKYMDMRNEFLKRLIDAVTLKHALINLLLENLSDGETGAILAMRYAELKTWEQIAAEMDLNVKTCIRKAKEGLKELETRL